MITLREYSDKISSMWVYELNGDDTPDTVSFGSGKVYWWRCNNNPKHVFQKQVCNMFNKTKKTPIGCIYCEAEHPKVFPGETDLFTVCPKAKEMWNYDRNVGFDLERINPGSSKNVWFECENNHSFQRTICNFINNQNCPICRISDNVIAKFPYMVKQWHFKKNKDIDINLTSSNAKKTAWWRCKKCGYEWQAQIASRRASKGECPCCETRIVVKKGATDLFSLYPELKEEYDFEKNSEIEPGTLSATSSIPVWWRCKKAGHKWHVSPTSRIVNRSNQHTFSKCPYCSGTKRDKSYADEYPDLAKRYLDEKNEYPFNNIEHIHLNSKYWWHCDICKNDFESTLGSMIRSRNSYTKGCSYCAGKKTKRENSFAYLHPDIMEEYDWTNNIINPYEITEKSSKCVRWICRNNPEHTWETSFNQRALGIGGCKICREYNYENKFYDYFPEFEQYYDTNKNIRPFTSYSVQSNEYVWWKCEKGHSFQRTICNSKQMGVFKCSICENHILEKGVNDLESQFPELANEFDSDKNGITPDNVIITYSNPNTWWKCRFGHEFQQSLYHRLKNPTNCPVCNRRIVVEGINDFLHAYPKIANIWDYTKNEKKPNEISDHCIDKFYFICDKGHRYATQLPTIIANDFECLICNEKILQVGVNTLLDTDYALSQEFSPNEKRRPEEFGKSSSYKILWMCPTCNGEYHYPINKRKVGDNTCPFCDNRRALGGYNTLDATNEKLAAEWSPNNIRLITDFFETSTYYALWICPTCSGEYGFSICEREVGDESCPYCNNRKVLAGLNSLQDTHKDLCKEWSTKNVRFPSEFMKSNTYNALWKCPTCSEEYSARICDREVDDESCPYCNNRKVLVGLNSLQDTHKDLCKEWSVKNDRMPYEFMKSSYYYALWECPVCHGEYRESIYNREVGDNSCPYCNNRKVLPGYNSFKHNHSDLMGEWNYVNNYLLIDPDNILDNYSKNVWWKCNKCMNNFQMSPQKRVYYKTRHMVSCPKCKGLRQKKKYFF